MIGCTMIGCCRADADEPADPGEAVYAVDAERAPHVDGSGATA
jgi:hypothetical protein